MGHELARDPEGFKVRGDVGGGGNGRCGDGRPVLSCPVLSDGRPFLPDAPTNHHIPPTQTTQTTTAQYLTLPPGNEDTALLLRARKLLQEVAASVQLDLGPVRIGSLWVYPHLYVMVVCLFFGRAVRAHSRMGVHHITTHSPPTPRARPPLPAAPRRRAGLPPWRSTRTGPPSPP